MRRPSSKAGRFASSRRSLTAPLEHIPDQMHVAKRWRSVPRALRVPCRLTKMRAVTCPVPSFHGSTALAMRGRKHQLAELQRTLMVGVVGAWLGVGMWTSYIHHISSLSVNPEIPEVGEQAPDFSIPFPEGFQVQLPMMPFPIQPKEVALSAFKKKKRAVLLVFYRAHW